MKKIIKMAGNWGPIVLLTLGTLWVIQGALAKTSSHGVIIQGGNYDAGTVKAGSVVKHAVRVFNLSSQPLTVDAQPGCGCTVVNVPDRPVASLCSGLVTMQVESEGMKTGEQNKGVELNLRSGQRSWQRIAIIKFKLN